MPAAHTAAILRWVALSVPAALAIARYRFRGREAMTALFMSPLMIPHVVLGVAFLRFFNIAGTGKPGRLIEIDDTSKIFSNPSQKATEDYISGRFG